MLNQIAIAARRTSRILTLRHPNAVDVAIYRKVLTRDNEAKFAEKPTLGGAMVLSPEDEAEYEIELIGEGKMLFLGRIEGAEHTGDGLMYSDGDISAYIEPLVDNEFEIKKYDRVFWVLPSHTVEYQISKDASPINIPPYTSIYKLQPIEHSPDGLEMP